MRALVFLFCLHLPCLAWSQTLSWELGPTGSRASFRGIHAASDEVIWICGSESTVLLSTDGGSTWNDVSPDFGELQFRSVHAWDANRACIASAGTPAIILLTQDGGKTWKEVHREPAKEAFLDGMAFWDEQNGVTFGDPINGTLFLLETKNGGQTWSEIKGLPKTREGEAGFAASDSSMLVGPKGAVWIGTGGAEADDSRVHLRPGWGKPWQVTLAPIASRQTQGLFSIAASQKEGSTNMVAVGGDYRAEALSPLTAVISQDSGRTWRPAKNPPDAFRSAVLHIGSIGWICTGPSGSDYSVDGDHWSKFSEAGFHAIALGENRVFATGSGGRFALLKTED